MNEEYIQKYMQKDPSRYKSGNRWICDVYIHSDEDQEWGLRGMFWKKQMNKHKHKQMDQILKGHSSDRHYDDTYSVELSALVVEKTFVCIFTSVLILGIVSKRWLMLGYIRKVNHKGVSMMCWPVTKDYSSLLIYIYFFLECDTVAHSTWLNRLSLLPPVVSKMT